MGVATQTLFNCLLEATKGSAALSDRKSSVVVENICIPAAAVKLVFYRACVSEFSYANSLESFVISRVAFFEERKNITLWVVHCARLNVSRYLVHHCKAPII